MSELPLGYIPFIEGYMAGLEGQDPRVCPHDKLTKEWVSWQRGHRNGVDVASQLKKEQT